ncbi:RidA family protein [Lichenicoccus sp.]|uniref:RidA family protein n=1 Tax=Lichenicoccus sp. TaxID=2781899 RepID=UPI003D1206CC
MTRLFQGAFALLLSSCLAASARAADVVRHPVANFPIASSVEVPAGYSTIYLSGVGPEPSDHATDTESQARSEIKRIAAELAALHLGLGDVVAMHVFMAPDPKTGKMDFAGMMKAYKAAFGTAAQPNLPTRAAFQVAGLAGPGMLLEIEVIAVRKP